MKKKCLLLFSILFLVFNAVSVYADSPLEIVAASAVLIEESTGKVLYGKDEHKKMYPASTTKVLTALVALEYLKPEEMIKVGVEINTIPWDSSKAGHKIGESITVLNLIRGLMLRSGNDSACTVALATAKKITGKDTMPYQEAEKIFTEKMVETAQALGAKNSRFVNPHGYHDDGHYTTAYDMALICKKAMENELIAQIVSETQFIGNGAGDAASNADLLTQDYNWTTHNLLLRSREFGYAGATGIKTGFTNEAGNCLAASSVRENKSFISVVFFSDPLNRWHDTAKLFDYGFENFKFKTFQNDGDLIEEMPLSGASLFEEKTTIVLAEGKFRDFINKADEDNIKRTVTYFDTVTAIDEENHLTLAAPLAKNQIVGEVTYTLHGDTLYKSNLIAGKEVLERTLQSDISYYWSRLKENAFTIYAIPFWTLGSVIIFLIILAVLKIKNSKRKNLYKLGRR